VVRPLDEDICTEHGFGRVRAFDKRTSPLEIEGTALQQALSFSHPCSLLTVPGGPTNDCPAARAQVLHVEGPVVEETRAGSPLDRLF